MDTTLRLMTASEIIVGIALVLSFFLPTGTSISFIVSPHRMIGFPIRWFVPLLLITVAGLCSATALAKMAWSMIHA
jgi:hypothetical protein